METGAEEGFIGVNVTDAAKERLIQQEWFEAGAPGLEALPEFWKGHGGGVGSEGLEAVGKRGGPFEAAESANVGQGELGSAAEGDLGAGVGVRRGIEKEFAGHAEVDGERSGVKMKEDVLAVAFQRSEGLAG
jgi:hypothetical protein